MEKQINERIEGASKDFKVALQHWLQTSHAKVVNDLHTDVTSDFLKFVFDYGTFAITAADLRKRKRVKNMVPTQELCHALRANDERCTRRKTDDGQFCGIHIKGQPNGLVKIEDNASALAGEVLTKVEVWVQEIKGINYYIDGENNVYKPEDILANKVRPAVVAKWTLNDMTQKYSIPAFGI